MSNEIRFVYVYDFDLSMGCGSKPSKGDENLPGVCERLSQSVNSKLGEMDKRSVRKDEFVFHNYKKNNKIYICVANESSKLRICYGLLETLGDEEIEVDNKTMCTKELSNKLKTYNDPGNDDIRKCADQISEIQEIMVENLDKIFENISKLEEIDAKVDELEAESLDFSHNASAVRSGVVRKNIILFGIICVVVLFVILVAVVIGLFGLGYIESLGFLNFLKQNNDDPPAS